MAGDQRRQGELTDRVELREVDGGAGSACAEILRLLPDWFGIPESNRNDAEPHPGVVGLVDDRVVGVTTVKRHSPYAAEIYLMAVAPR